MDQATSGRLIFDAATHTYTVDGVVYPSVTQVLRPLYDFSMVGADVLEHKRQIGVATHLAIKLWLDEELEDASVVDPWAGYFRGWLKFWDEMGLTRADVGEAEKPLAHPAMRLAGTPDLPLFIAHGWAVVDVKTADNLHPAWALQTAAYQELINLNTAGHSHEIKRRYSLRLREDGTYRLDEHTNKGDWATFLSFYSVHRFMQNHNLLEKP